MKVIVLMICHARVPFVLYSRQWLDNLELLYTWRQPGLADKK